MERTFEGTARRQGAAEPHRDVACLVAGCPCKDPRIVSTRRARFFAAVARFRGETADRVVRPEPGWTLPAVTVGTTSRPSFGALG